MSLVNVISALGNNSSIYPLLVRDCGIENVAKCAMTYKQNVGESKFIARQATRERIIDEYGTSAVWLGGIPLLNKVSDLLIKKVLKLSPEVDIKLLNGTDFQNVQVNQKQFAESAKDAVADLVNVANKKTLFKNAQVAKFLATTIIPITFMGFILPKLNFSYTKKKIAENQRKKNINNQQDKNFTSMSEFMKDSKKNKNVSFKGLNLDSLANMSDLNKMAILDGGLTVGRVATGRNKSEKAELAFKMAGMCYLNYLAPKTLEKLLNKATKNIFGINTNLDIKLLDNSAFRQVIEQKSLELPKNVDEKSLLEFIDNNPKSLFTQQARKLDIVRFLKDKDIRDPRKFVDISKLANLKNEIEQFAKDALESKDVSKFVKKAMSAKTFNTFANIGISSFLLAVMLPKLQFLFRKLITGSKVDPGISLEIKEDNIKNK